MTTPDPDVQPIVEALVGTRTRAPLAAEMISSRDRGALGAIQDLKRLTDATNQSIGQMWVEVVTEGIGIVTDEIKRDVCRELFCTEGKIDARRKRLVDRYRDELIETEPGRQVHFSLDQLRRTKTGIEEAWAFPALAIEINSILHDRLQRLANEFPTLNDGIDHRNELFIGLVAALKTDTRLLTGEAAENILSAELDRAGYYIYPIKLSSAFAEVPRLAQVLQNDSKDAGLYEYLMSRMDAGDMARKVDPGILAKLAIKKVSDDRDRVWNDHVRSPGRRGVAYLFDSVMHPAEVDVLRSTYGTAFFLLAVHEHEDQRKRRLITEPGMRVSARKLAKVTGSPVEGLGEEKAKEKLASILIDRNRGRSLERTYPQRESHQLGIEEVFYLADVFIDVEDPGGPNNPGLSSHTLRQFVELIFSEPFNTASKSELGMAHAYVASLRSSSMSRRVGSAVCARTGELLATGANEVPEPGGGEQWPKEENASTVDTRDFRLGDGTDSNDKMRHEIFSDLLMSLHHAGVRITAPGQLDVPAIDRTRPEADIRIAVRDLAAELVALGDVRGSQLFDITEFGRAVHAEMSALLAAGRHGISLQGATLYCTTLPCHECARHIIAAGIRRVIYIEPYTKSRAFLLHEHEIVLGARNRKKNGVRDDVRVEFFPFVGVAPPRQSSLYSFQIRRQRGDEAVVGRRRDWDLTNLPPLRDSVLPADRLQLERFLETRAAFESAMIEDATNRTKHGLGQTTGDKG